ncbi:MAG: hypothetical protein JJU22_08555 [Gammaproteobacteria bacterium]|jgi:hypothetical protein|nr:hypothetical protein [Gammaproteobacteria bacterium]
MRTLTEEEVDEVSGGLGWGSGGAVALGLGFAAISFGPAVPIFGLAVGGSMLYLHVAQMTYR